MHSSGLVSLQKPLLVVNFCPQRSQT